MRPIDLNADAVGAGPGTVPDDALAPPPRHPRFPLLDGLRAIAVLAVVLVHVAFFAQVGTSVPAKLLLHLNLGVTIFFLISGFLLYRPFIAHRLDGPAAPAVGTYLKRRFLRIFPAYWVVLLALALLPDLTGVVGDQWWGMLVLIQTLPIGDGPSCVSAVTECGLAQTWSLVVELTFYAALPLYVLAANGLARGRRPAQWLSVELLLLGGLAVVSVVLHFGVSDGGPRSFVGGTLLGYGLWFAAGMALALVSVALDADGRRPKALSWPAANPLVCWLAAFAVYVALSLTLPATPFVIAPSDQLTVHLGFALIALLLIVPAVFGDSLGGAPRRLLAQPAVAWLGLISYGIFLWHFVVTVKLGFAGEGLGFVPLLLATLAITIPVAAISYYAVERPILRLKYRRILLPREGSSSEPDPRGAG